MRRTVLPVAAALIGLLLAAASSSAQEETAPRGPTVVVLDASGSMWGRIDGRPKIEIAREALGELLSGWDAGAGLGLTVYGHRRKGDCGDIEHLVEPGSGGPEAVRRAVEGLNPKGKTPLSDAVRQAAERLRHAERPASVILLSDGRESCGADPCAVGAELERTGVDFTAHVIGFDVEGPARSGLRCLAENTSGRFFSAGRAEELRTALGEAAERVREGEAGVTLKAVDRRDGPALQAEGLRWTVEPAGGGQPALSDSALAVPRPDLTPGTWVARVRLGDATAEKRFTVGPDAPAVHELVLELEASLESPDTVEAGGTVEVGWDGPDNEGDYVTIVPADAGEGEYGAYAYTRDGDPLTLELPGEPGDYEIRYLSGGSNTTLARSPLQLTAPGASVRAPDTVEAGGTVEVSWDGPDNEGDYVTIVPADAGEGEYGAYAYTRDGDPLTLELPGEPGDYEIRYLDGGSDRTLARTSVRIEAAGASVRAPDAVEASLEAPRSVEVGAEVKIRWQGPDNEGDYVTIVPADAGEGEYGAYAYTRSGNPVTIQAPEEPGEYEIRYLSGQSDRTLARRELTVEP